MKRALVLAAIIFLPGTPAEAARCTLPGAHTVASNKRARLFTVAASGATTRRWFGCLKGRRPFLLAADVVTTGPDPSHTKNDLFRLGGTWVGWHAATVNDADGGQRAAQVVVRSLTGAHRVVRQDVSRYSMTNLRVGAAGDAAWVLAAGDLREVDGVARGATVPTPLAVAAGIESESLTLAGRRVRFSVFGKARSVRLTAPAAPSRSKKVGPQGLDARFGDCGTLVPAKPAPNVFTGATQLARTPDGLLIAAGSATSGRGDPLTQDTFVVSRFTVAGQFDPLFGDAGVATLAVPWSPDARSATVTGAVVTPDGGVVIAGTIDLAGPGESEVLLARFTSAGVLDASFGTDGIVSNAVPAAASARIADLAIDGDGLLVAGQRDGRFMLARFTARGEPDDAFGRSGVTIDAGRETSRFGAVAVGKDGTIFAGGGGVLPLLARFSNSGNLISSSTAGPPATAMITSLEMLGDGRVMAAGSATNVNGDGQAYLARYTAAGRLDPAFGDNGAVLDPQIGSPSDIAVAPGGAVYLNASFFLLPGRYAGDGLIRYAASGVRDTGFGIRGALGGTSSFGLRGGDVLIADDPGGPTDGTAYVAQDNAGAFAVSRLAITAPATAAVRGRSSVCAMATGDRIGPLVQTRLLDVSLRLRAPGKLRLLAVVRIGKRSVKAGRADVFRPYTEGAVATVGLSRRAVRLLRKANSARLVVTAGAPGRARTTYRMTLRR